MRTSATKRHPESDSGTASILPRTAQSAVLLSTVLAFGLATSACASWGKKETGAAVGTAAGAGAGAVIGSKTGSTARGAIVGAVVGGTAGAIIGHQMDKQAEELEEVVPEAVVERVGEGIQVTFASGLLYDFDSAVIRPAAAENLRKLAASLKEYPNTELLIVGHTDSSGSDAYNETLSGRRADAALDYLVEQGIASSRMHASGRGEMEPVATNESEAGRQTNRRIEVAIFASEEAASPQ